MLYPHVNHVHVYVRILIMYMYLLCVNVIAACVHVVHVYIMCSCIGRYATSLRALKQLAVVFTVPLTVTGKLANRLMDVRLYCTLFIT